MTIKFSTHLYQISHGKTPRGLGTWAFVTSRMTALTATRLGVSFPDIHVEDTGEKSIIYCTGGARSLVDAKKMVRQFLNIVDQKGAYFRHVEVAP